MAAEVTMPKLGLTMVDGKLVEWKKREGQEVEKGEIILVIETEKVTYEVEAPASGTLGKIVVPEGDTVPVGEVLAYILQPGETLAELPAKAKAGKKVETPAAEAAASAPAPTSTTVQPREGAIGEMGGGRLRISPLARKLAEEHGVDVSGITGTGPAGRIVQEDILRAVEQAKVGEAKPASAREATAEGLLPTRAKLLPLTGMRRTIARRMSLSFQTAPHFWAQTQVDATNLIQARETLMPAIEAKTGLRLTYTDLLVMVVAHALEEYPIVNSRWTEEGIEVLEDINIGVATNVEDGLIVPVIRQANKQSLSEITSVRADLVERGRKGKLGVDEMTGGTFTITNVGMLGGDSTFPIINPPEAAILATGTIAEKAMVQGGQVVARPCQSLTLAIDHRVLDGAIAAQFLSKVREMIEQPLLLFYKAD